MLALLTATALLAALASGLLLLLTGLLLATLLATLLLAGLLLAALLLAALLRAALHITHLIVRHGELSFAEGLRAEIIILRVPWSRSKQMWLAGMPEPRCKPAVSSNCWRAERSITRGPRKLGYRQWQNTILMMEQMRPNPARIADPC